MSRVNIRCSYEKIPRKDFRFKEPHNQVMILSTEKHKQINYTTTFIEAEEYCFASHKLQEMIRLIDYWPKDAKQWILICNKYRKTINLNLSLTNLMGTEEAPKIVSNIVPASKAGAANVFFYLFQYTRINGLAWLLDYFWIKEV
uniref:Uncharacterized protein n=1 Tax=Glossina austeni TaxID=7395 RepID=A0A1A9VWF4_GLOAU